MDNILVRTAQFQPAARARRFFSRMAVSYRLGEGQCSMTSVDHRPPVPRRTTARSVTGASGMEVCAGYGVANVTDRGLWHPWLRINRVLRAMLHARRSAEAWPQVKAEFKKALALKSQIRRAGWFN